MEKLKIHKLKIFVGILGVLVFAGAVFGVYKLGQRQIRPGLQPTPTPLPSEAPAKEGDLIPGWKTYTNAKYGFSIKYSPDWSVKEDKTLQGLALLMTTFSSPDGNALLDIWVRSSDWEESKKEFLQKGNYNETIVGGQPALVSGEGNFLTIQSKEPNQIIQIVYGGEHSKELLNLMLSTFRFLPSAGSGQGE